MGGYIRHSTKFAIALGAANLALDWWNSRGATPPTVHLTESQKDDLRTCANEGDVFNFDRIITRLAPNTPAQIRASLWHDCGGDPGSAHLFG